MAWCQRGGKPLVRPATLQWRHNEHDGVSSPRRLHCLLNRLFRRRSKKTPRLRVSGLCEGNSPVAGELSAQRASNAENVSIRWRHNERSPLTFCFITMTNVLILEMFCDKFALKWLGENHINFQWYTIATYLQTGRIFQGLPRTYRCIFILGVVSV